MRREGMRSDQATAPPYGRSPAGLTRSCVAVTGEAAAVVSQRLLRQRDLRAGEDPRVQVLPGLHWQRLPLARKREGRISPRFVFFVVWSFEVISNFMRFEVVSNFMRWVEGGKRAAHRTHAVCVRHVCSTLPRGFVCGAVLRVVSARRYCRGRDRQQDPALPQGTTPLTSISAPLASTRCAPKLRCA
jgi:hypothetical protein